jgi:osmotically-inducible protein OsmY
VVTENGEVFLMGLVTQKEADIAVNITRNISGVNSVYKAFEYL